MANPNVRDVNYKALPKIQMEFLDGYLSNCKERLML